MLSKMVTRIVAYKSVLIYFFLTVFEIPFFTFWTQSCFRINMLSKMVTRIVAYTSR